jgi:hypothetical protein
MMASVVRPGVTEFVIADSDRVTDDEKQTALSLAIPPPVRLLARRQSPVLSAALRGGLPVVCRDGPAGRLELICHCESSWSRPVTEYGCCDRQPQKEDFVFERFRLLLLKATSPPCSPVFKVLCVECVPRRGDEAPPESCAGRGWVG